MKTQKNSSLHYIRYTIIFGFSFVAIIFLIKSAKAQSYFTHDVYIAPYVGDIDGSVSENWFHFYDTLGKFYEDNNIPVGISFYPATINNNPEFVKAFLRMYNDPNIELIQKGNNGDENEMIMATLPIEQQRAIIKAGQDNFKNKMSQILGTTPNSIILPEAYNQIHGSFSDQTVLVAEPLGIKQYFDMFVEGGMQQVKSTPTFKSIQYGVSWTVNGQAGRENPFKSEDQVMSELSNYTRADINLTYINGLPVIPLWAHQQDFEDIQTPEKIDQSKWAVYTKTILDLKNDPHVHLVRPIDVYNLQIKNKVNQLEPTSNQAPIKSIAPISMKISSPSEFYTLQIPIFETTIDLPNQYYFFPQKSSNEYTFTYDHSLYNATLKIPANESLYLTQIIGKNSLTHEEINLSLKTIGNFSTTNINKIGVDTIILKTNHDKTNISAPILSGNSLPPNNSKYEVEICTWSGCARSAVTFSVDDSFTSCLDELNRYGYHGTYYLTHTNNLSQQTWDTFEAAYKEGHELGTHTETHWCVQESTRLYKNDILNNIKDILAHTTAKPQDIVTHAYPCGFYTPQLEKTMQTSGNFIAARSYNVNGFEDSTPSDMFALKSINSHEYPGGTLEPQNYTQLLDTAIEQKKLANFVFHIECSDDGIIDQLPAKNVWVETVGNVARYIYLRDNLVTSNFTYSDSQVSFKTSLTNQTYASPEYKESVSLRIRVNKDVDSVLIDNKKTSFKWEKDIYGYNIIFDLPFPPNHNVEVKFKQ